jgi:hypothetical protein
MLEIIVNSTPFEERMGQLNELCSEVLGYLPSPPLVDTVKKPPKSIDDVMNEMPKMKTGNEGKDSVVELLNNFSETVRKNREIEQEQIINIKKSLLEYSSPSNSLANPSEQIKDVIVSKPTFPTTVNKTFFQSFQTSSSVQRYTAFKTVQQKPLPFTPFYIIPIQPKTLKSNAEISVLQTPTKSQEGEMKV